MHDRNLQTFRDPLASAIETRTESDFDAPRRSGALIIHGVLDKDGTSGPFASAVMALNVQFQFEAWRVLPTFGD